MTPNGIADPLSTSEPDAKAWPSFVLGGRTFEVKFGLLSEYYLSLWGIELPNLLNFIRPAMKSTDPSSPLSKQVADPKHVSYMFQLIAAQTAHNFIAPDQPRTPEQWVIALDGNEDAMKDAMKCVMEAAIKYVSARLKKVVPTPTVEKAETTLTQ